MAEALGVSMAELDRILDRRPPTVNGQALDVTALGGTSLLVRIEQGAVRSQVIDVQHIPALLQTREYATALEGAYHRPLSDSEVVERVDLRLSRAAALDRQPTPLVYQVRIPWHVLGQPRGDDKVMFDQLDHLASMAERPNVDIRIIPAQPDVVTLPTSFTLLTTGAAGSPDLATVDGPRGYHYEESSSVVSELVEVFADVTRTALSTVKSIDYVRLIQEEYRH